MTVQATVTLTGNPQTLAAVLAGLAYKDLEEEVIAANAVLTPKVNPKKTTTKTKTDDALEASAEDEETETEDTEDEDAADEDTDIFEDEEDEVEVETKSVIEPGKSRGRPKKTLDLEKDVIPAFRAYVKKYSKEKAGKVLSKFGVKSVRDLNTDDYAKVIATLKV